MLCHTRNINGELSTWVFPESCPCSTCIDYCQEKGLINTTVTGGGGASSAPSGAEPTALAPAPTETTLPTPPIRPVLERQNGMTLNFPTTNPVLERQNANIFNYPAMDNEMDILGLEGMIFRWRRRIRALEDAMSGPDTRIVAHEINSLLSRIVQAQNVIDLIRSIHYTNVTNADTRSFHN